MENNSVLSSSEISLLLSTLKTRFEKNKVRHHDLEWNEIQLRLTSNLEKLRSLFEMENTGGEPDVVGFDKRTGEYLFFDCSKETPKGRVSLCYDKEAFDSRKEFKPSNNAVEAAANMGVELLSEEEYKELQRFGNFDTKTSSWINTPSEVRKLGGAIFGDYRYGRVFIYHNGAQSYYNSRGFRCVLKV